MSEHTAPRITVATAWLDGCSGCHMSFLDIDERLFELMRKVDIVYSPLVDAKSLPAQVDVGILEAVSYTHLVHHRHHRHRNAVARWPRKRRHGWRHG